MNALRVITVISTKGGVGKTTLTANLGGLLADAGLRVLLLDLDSQPTLSSYYPLSRQAPGGAFELLALNQTDRQQVVSITTLSGLHLIASNDDKSRLAPLLQHAADGRLRLRNLLPAFSPDYDVVLIDTQGARSVLLEMALLACDLALSPVTPQMLAARELHRGTLKLLEDLLPFRLGVAPPPLRLLLNLADGVKRDARMITLGLREAFPATPAIALLHTQVPARVAYLNAATLGLPVHRVERRRPHGRRSPAALQVMCALAVELFPEWREALSRLDIHSRPSQ